MAGYVNEVFAGDTEKVPAGVTLFCPKSDGGVAEVTSHGDQTLLGIAQAQRCQCSGIVRATAEHSPGGKYPDAVAAFLRRRLQPLNAAYHQGNPAVLPEVAHGLASAALSRRSPQRALGWLW